MANEIPVKNTIKFLIALDALLDTRLATIAGIHSDFAVELMTKGWTTRELEYDPQWNAPFTEEVYQHAYQMRTVETLMQSVVTRIPSVIHDLVKDDIENPAIACPDLTHQLHVNLFPYRFQEDEKQLLLEILTSHFPLVSDIKLVDYGPKQLSPGFLKRSDYTVHITYDFKEWLTYQGEALGKCPLPGHFLIAPRILSERVVIDDSEEDVVKQAAKVASPFDAFELQLLDHLSVRFIDVKMFSSIIVE